MKNQRAMYNAYSAVSPIPINRPGEGLKIVQNRQNFSYIFYTGTGQKSSYNAIQFRRLHPEQNVYGFHLSVAQVDKKEINSFITSTYIHTDDPKGTIAQIIVDFIISQPVVRLIVDKDPRFFKDLLTELWPEFNGLFEIKGLRKGHWEICNCQIAYDAYSLMKLL